jgi:formamidopyrimidine-DNA glycosylase
MPELPEVETVARLLRPELEGRRIVASEVRWRRSLGGQAPHAFERAVVGARAARVGRRGKFVRIDLERRGRAAGALLVHLRMTGRLQVRELEPYLEPYVRVRCRLDDGRRLTFVDVRKFGRFLWRARPEDVLSELGPEPLEPEFSVEWLHTALARRRRVLKSLLLDQSFVAGLGNIYADESLFRAGLHPLARSDRLTRAQVTRLHAAIRVTLARAIEREGSSFDAFYRTPAGNPGSYQDEFQVYGRAGEPCRACAARIARLVVGQRGTHVCPRCQSRSGRCRAPSALQHAP